MMGLNICMNTDMVKWLSNNCYTIDTSVFDSDCFCNQAWNGNYLSIEVNF